MSSHETISNEDKQRFEVAEIKELLCDPTSGLGETITREISDYTVALISSNQGHPELAGTGTLISFLDAPYILTASHVWEERLKTAGAILIPLEEKSHRRSKINPLHIVPLGPERPSRWNEWGPDITMLRLPPELVGDIKALGRSFFNLSLKRERVIDCGIEVRFLMGAPKLRGTFTATSAFPEIQGMLVQPKSGQFMSISMCSNVRSEFDYIDFDIDTSQPDVAPRFGGVSGGGLWQVYVYKNPNGQIDSFKVLEGLAFWEEPHDSGLVVRCHGPLSIGTALRYLF